MVAVGCVVGADDMVTTGIVEAMIWTEALLTDGAGRAAGCTKIGLALGTRFHRQRPALTAWAFDQTFMAIGLMVNGFVKTRPNRALTGGAAHQTILAEALPAGATRVDLSAVLLTAGTTHRTFIANISRFTCSHFHLINT